MSRDDRVEPRRAYEDALRGSFGALDDVLGRLPEEHEWALALRALRYFALARPTPEELPDRDALLAFVDAAPPGRVVASLAAAQRLRAALLAFDVRAMEETKDVMSRLAGGLTVSEATDWLAIAEGWLRIAHGDADTGKSERDDVEAVEARSRRAGHADTVIEATVVRAHHAELEGQLDDALSLARRASRMARSESIPQLEFLAHLCLARIRRVSGQPHLTMRIVTGLSSVATPPWRPWLAWERILCGGADPVGDDAGSALPKALLAVLSASRRGDVAAYDEAARSLEHVASPFAPVLVDVAHLLSCIDPRVDLDRAPRAVRELCCGLCDEVPRGLTGVCGVDVEQGAPHVYVFSAPGRPPRRVLSPGAGLCQTLCPDAVLVRGDGRQLRTDSAIAALVLAGEEGSDEGVLFRQLYGFDYEPALHQSVRGVLYGRIKKRLSDVAELVRDEGRIRIEHRGLLVADPRSSPPPEQRILSILAERKRTRAKDLAQELGIPLRTAQQALRRLRDDGVLRSEKAARGLHYILEDTTFSEPTRDARY